METTATFMTQAAATALPRFSGMSHVSLPCRDLEESKIRLRANESGKMRLQKDKIGLSAWHCDV